jgi:hypothetical protein
MGSVLAFLGLLGLTAAPAVAMLRAHRREAGRPGARARSAPPVPGRRPLQQVAADVRRLARSTALVPAGTPMARLRGLWAAYDDVLVEAAALLEVPHTLGTAVEGRARDVERLRLVAALERAGLVVRG